VLTGRDAVLLRPVDGSNWLAPDELALFKVSPKAGWPGPTPISWANKPFEVIRVEDTGE